MEPSFESLFQAWSTTSSGSQSVADTGTTSPVDSTSPIGGGSPFSGSNPFAGGSSSGSPLAGGNGPSAGLNLAFSSGNAPYASYNETLGNDNVFLGGIKNVTAGNENLFIAGNGNETVGNYNVFLGSNNATIGNGNWYLGSDNAVKGDFNLVLGSGIGKGDPIISNNNILIGDGVVAPNIKPEAVPEPGSALGMLAFGIGIAGLLLKRKMNRKKAAISA